MNHVPRSAYDRTGGLVNFARMLDKIRRPAAGPLRADFHPNLGAGFDARCCHLLGVILPATAADLPWFTRHLTSMDVGPTCARLDGRELDPTDNWVRFGDRAISTEIGRTQRTTPSESSKTLRS